MYIYEAKYVVLVGFWSIDGCHRQFAHPRTERHPFQFQVFCCEIDSSLLRCLCSLAFVCKTAGSGIKKIINIVNVVFYDIWFLDEMEVEEVRGH